MTAAGGWSVVVPLKSLSQAKSRMRDLPMPIRQALVAAMALDVRDAVLACPLVEELVVITGDSRWHGLLRSSRVRIVPDSPEDSLNRALQRGADACWSTRPGVGLAALTGDLPALRPQDLDRALDLALGAPTSFVPDAHGEGTTMFAARSVEDFRPQFGDRSRARHVVAGAREILWPEMGGIRHDVDTVSDLEGVLVLGVGEHTNAVATDLLASASRQALRDAVVQLQ